MPPWETLTLDTPLTQQGCAGPTPPLHPVKLLQSTQLLKPSLLATPKPPTLPLPALPI